MPVFALDDELIFPHPCLREPDGLMAVGGDLLPERLLLAYRWGIFPWFHKDQPILWWWLAPRMMLSPQEVHISRSMYRELNKETYRISMDQDFRGVMEHCGSVKRKGQQGTWIMPEMLEAFVALHQLGYAHSVEVMDDDGLAGGVYGIALGKIFFGESMFAVKPNASKIALIHLARHLESKGFLWLDCQMDTPHMRTMGAKLVEEDDFLNILRENQSYMLHAKNGEHLF